VALPTTAVPYGSFTIYNSGSVDAYYQKGGAGCTATTSSPSIRIAAGTSITDWVGANTYVCAITGSSSATLLLWQATGPIAFAGGGGSGGGSGGNVTIVGPLGQTTMSASVPVAIASNQSGVPVTAASLPLPTGAATSALQTTGNSSLSTIATNTTNAGTPTLQSGSTTAVTQGTASNLNATVVGTTSAGSGASSGLVTVQGNASGTPVPISSGVADNTSSSGQTYSPIAGLGATNCNAGTGLSNTNIGAINVDLLRNLCVKVTPSVGSFVKGVGTQTTLNTSTQIVAAVSSKVLYITQINCNNSGSTAFVATIQDGSGGTALDYLAVPAGAGNNVTGGGQPIYSTTSGNGLYFSMSASSTTGSCHASGFSQ